MQSELLEFLQNIGIDFLVGVFGTLFGVGLKTLYDVIKKRIHLRHMSNVFGDIEDLRGQVRFVLPKFKPLTYDDFAPALSSLLSLPSFRRFAHDELILPDIRSPGRSKLAPYAYDNPPPLGITYLYKDYLVEGSGAKLEDRRVPLYSDVIVIDDYKAFKRIDKLFADFGYGALEFCDDINALKDWKKKLILCLGGPRSNQKLRQLINIGACDFVCIDDSSDSLADWRLTYSVKGESGEIRVTEDRACAYIFKVKNPNYPDGRIIVVAGDSGESTDNAARYLSENLVTLSRKYGRSNFLLILKSDRNSYESIKIEKEFTLEG